MGRRKGVPQTGRVAAERRQRAARRAGQKEAIVSGTIASDVPEPLVPECFQQIQSTYWNCLQAVPDPRVAGQTVYPLYQILHRIITGFLGGTRAIGVLFPRRHRDEQGLRGRRAWRLGPLPTRADVYVLLRRIDWAAAQVALAPLWQQLGYAPEWTMQRHVRDIKDILEELRRGEAEKAAQKRAEIQAAQRAAERAQGMSAAKALRQGRRRRKPKSVQPSAAPSLTGRQVTLRHPSEPAPAPPAPAAKTTGVAAAAVAAAPALRQDLLLDGKVVRASYNAGSSERFVHVSAVRLDTDQLRHRFIVGTQATVLDRQGEWGAAFALLDTVLPPPPGQCALISGDAGLCVQEHAAGLTARNGYYLFRIKANAGGLFQRVIDWADGERALRPKGDFFEAARRSGADIHSRRLWRLPGLRFANFPGLTEAFVVEKKSADAATAPELQYYITSYPRTAWTADQILDRILLHWDTETGLFGVKDNTFDEDSVRYKHLAGAMAHVVLLNTAINCLWAPAFASYWSPDAPLSERIQFFRDHPDYCPIRSP